VPKQITEAAKAFLKRLEGLRLTAYFDKTNYAIGYGHNDASIQSGDTITQEEAEQLLEKDIDKFARKFVYVLLEQLFEKDIDKFARAVNSAVKVPLTNNQFSALVVLAYNIGISGFKSSTLLKQLNTGNIEGTIAEWKRWIYSGGQPDANLERRREKEVLLFLRPDDMAYYA